MIDITKSDADIIRGILGAIAPRVELVAFGSRVQGTARRYSDLDLAVKVDDCDLLMRLRDAFSESDLSIMIDVVDYNRASEIFRTIIDATGCEWELTENKE